MSRCHSLTTTAAAATAAATAEEEMKKVAKQLRLESLMAHANEIVLDLCAEVSNKEMKSICKEAIREVHEERERKIRELQVQ